MSALLLWQKGARNVGIESPHMLRQALVAIIACAAVADAAGLPQQAGPGSLIVNGRCPRTAPPR